MSLICYYFIYVITPFEYYSELSQLLVITVQKCLRVAFIMQCNSAKLNFWLKIVKV